jgi:hypothetical protein
VLDRDLDRQLRPRSRATGRVVVAVASIVCLLASLLVADWHVATVRHGWCAEHGVQTHLGDKHSTVAAAVDHHAGASALPGDDGEGREADDEHCTLGPQCQDHAVPTLSAPPAIDAPQLISILTSTPVAVVADATGLYRVAPKTSPPRA